jgi:hypothetical protein
MRPSEIPDGPDLTLEQEEELFAQAEPVFQKMIQTGKESDAMWIPDMRIAPWFGAAMLAATAQPAQAAPGYALGRCLIDEINLPADIRPTYDGGMYLVNYHGEDPRYKEKLTKGEFFEGAKVTLVKAPKHGKVVYSDDPLAVEFRWYSYQGNKGYGGRDRFVMQVEKDGVKVRIHYVVEVLGEETASGHCQPEHWKISVPATPSGIDTAGVVGVSLNPLLSFAGIGGLDGIPLDFAPLPNGALGQTTGTTITLDTNAAGWGWFIDATPDLNEEFLPTADPTVWKAKAGSAAEGKMDMLSVLLHEYGHTLGLEHSADSHSYLAATLQPGASISCPTLFSLLVHGMTVVTRNIADFESSGAVLFNPWTHP